MPKTCPNHLNLLRFWIHWPGTLRLTLELFTRVSTMFYQYYDEHRKPSHIFCYKRPCFGTVQQYQFHWNPVYWIPDLRIPIDCHAFPHLVGNRSNQYKSNVGMWFWALSRLLCANSSPTWRTSSPFDRSSNQFNLLRYTSVVKRNLEIIDKAVYVRNNNGWGLFFAKDLTIANRTASAITSTVCCSFYSFWYERTKTAGFVNSIAYRYNRYAGALMDTRCAARQEYNRKTGLDSLWKIR